MGKTNRGFLVEGFTDLYNAPCSIQESSLGRERAIWLGVDDTTHGGFTDYGRMHLSQDMVKKLLPILEYFSENGELPS